MNVKKMALNLLIYAGMLIHSQQLYGEVRAAFLGESCCSGKNGESMNEKVLNALFSLIKDKKPSAVFFTGDMTLGLTREVALTSDRTPAPFGDIYGNQWDRKGYFYESAAFTNQLASFSTLLARSLGSSIPFYPVMAFNDSVGPDAADLFRSHFHLKNQLSNEASQLAYTVSLKNAFFVVFSTSHYDEALKTVVQHDLNPALLAWIDLVLKENRSRYDFLFVVSNEPAFSTEATQGKFRGFDTDEENRNAFWHILWQNGVLAYFCSGERLYDRSNRFGTWQIISGGAGAPLYDRPFDRAFYHYVLLDIPSNKEQSPKVEVYDMQGNLMDTFKVIPKQYPIYQLRIS